MNPRDSQQVFKVTTRAAWDAARATGVLAPSQDDERDGFIHLSTADQLEGTLAKHFEARRDLVLIALDTAALGGQLRWEPSRGGQLFPHLYAALPTTAARSIFPLELDEKGAHIVPQAVQSC